MKKKVLITILFIISVVAGLFILTGFFKRSDVFLYDDFKVSEDGSKLSMHIGIGSSMGFVRDCKVLQGGNNLYISFYSAFGGLNSSIGAKDVYEIDLNPSCTQIYFYRGDGGYKLVLEKNEQTGKWERQK